MDGGYEPLTFQQPFPLISRIVQNRVLNKIQLQFAGAISCLFDLSNDHMLLNLQINECHHLDQINELLKLCYPTFI